MKWTSDKPIAGGWYWIRGPWLKAPIVVMVDEHTGGRMAVSIAEKWAFVDAITAPIEWYGPLPVPE